MKIKDKKDKKKYLIKFQIYNNRMYLTENLDEMNEIIPKINKKTTEMLTHPYSNEIGKKNWKKWVLAH